MLTLPESPRAMKVRTTKNALFVRLEDGRELYVPIVWFYRLADAKPKQLRRFELVGGGTGIHWPDLDEDVSVAALLARPCPGDCSSRTHTRTRSKRGKSS
jgi:Protein of unknown function (DUF2442)